MKTTWDLCERDRRRRRLKPSVGKILDNLFQCEVCTKLFRSERSDEDAVRECERTFGSIEGQRLMVVCDSCWQQFVKT